MDGNEGNESEDDTPDWLTKANEETLKNDTSNDPWTEDVLTNDFENV